MRRNPGLPAIALLTLVFTVAPAFAVDNGFYFGVIGGQSDFAQSQQGFDEAVIDAFDQAGTPVITGTSDLDSKDIAFGAVAGWRIFTYLAVEAGYIDLGEFNYQADVTIDLPPDTPAQATFDATAKGPMVSVMGILPFNDDWDMYGRYGLFFSDTELAVGVTIDGVGGSDTLSASSEDQFYAVGVAWHVGDRWTFRAEYTKFQDVGEEDETGEQNVKLLSLAFFFRI